MTDDWISKLRVQDLKEELKKRNLPVSGKKAELAERLTEAVNKEADEKEPSPADAEKESADVPSETKDASKDPEPSKPELEDKGLENGDADLDAAAAQKQGHVEGPDETIQHKAMEDESEGKGKPHSAPQDLTEAEVIQKIEAEAVEEAKADLAAEPSEPKDTTKDEPREQQVSTEPRAENDVKHANAPEGEQVATESTAEDDAEAVPETKQVDSVNLDNPPTDAIIDTSEAAEAKDTNGRPAETPKYLNEQTVEDEAHEGKPVASAVDEPVKPDTMVTEERPQDNLAAMQAALLAPETKAETPVGTAEEEELVDFEADEIVEEPTKAELPKSAPKELSKGEKRAAEEPSTTIKTKEQLPDSSTPSQQPSSKRQRQPIPSFRSLETKSTVKPSSLSGKASTDAAIATGRKSVFDRVSGAGEEVPRGPGAPPSRVQATTALLVTGFVRPFTVKAAQNLFEAHGNISKFWMPAIRDKAISIYETSENAEAARQALHGLEWPVGSRTSLRPKFVSEEEAEQAISSTGKDLQARGSGLAHKGSGVGAAVTEAAAQSAQDPQEKRKSDKVDGEAGGVPKRARVEAKPKEEEKVEEKAVTLEDLFRKTEASPHLYWLPLSDEAIAAKEKAKASQKPFLQREKEDAKKKVEAPKETAKEEKLTREKSKEDRVSKDRPREEKGLRESIPRDRKRDERESRSARETRDRDGRRDDRRRDYR